MKDKPDSEDLPPTSKTIKLVKPVDAHGKKITELTFREPTGRDILAAGGPPVTVLGGKEEFLPENTARMMSRLADVPPSTIAALSMADWMQGAVTIASFLVPDGASSSTDTSSAPTTGGEIQDTRSA